MLHPAFRLAAVLTILLPMAVDATAMSIHGTILRPGGASLSGTRVELQPMPSSFELEASLWRSQWPSSPEVTTTTDIAGRFALEIPGPGVWQVEVSSPGFVPMRYSLLPLANSTEMPPVTLRPVVKTRVTVVDSAGHPVAGAGVYARSASQGLWRENSQTPWRPTPRLGWTDADGQLELLRARGERLELWAHLPGRLTISAATGGREVTLRLQPKAEPAARLEVRDADDEAVPGVLVILRETGWPLGRSGADGTVHFSPASEPVGLRLLTADGHSQKATWQPITPQAAVMLPPTVAITGRVRDASGNPIADALVWPGLDPGNFVRSDVEGRYEIRAAAAGSLRVQAHAQGFVPRSRRVSLEEPLPESVDVFLSPAASLYGRVIDGEGRAVAGVQVEAVARGERPPAIRPDSADGRTWSDAEGRFVLDSLVPDTAYAIQARRPGFGASELLATPSVRGRGKDLEVVLHHGRLAYGRVLDFDEKPLASIEIKVLTAGATAAAPAPGLAAISDDTGRFEVRGALAPRLDVAAQGRGFAPLTVRGVEVSSGDQPVDLGTLYLEPGAKVQGRVTNLRGEPIPEVSVWAKAAAEQEKWLEAPAGEPQATSGDGGRFTVEGLERDLAIDLYIDAERYLPIWVRGLKPSVQEPIVVVLEPASRVLGEVIDEAGEPVAHAEVGLYPAAPESSSADGSLQEERRSQVSKSDEDGRFEIDGVAPGSVEIEAYSAGFQPTPLRRFEVGQGEDVAGLRLVLVRGATLEGQVTDADHQPIAGAQVSVGRPETRTDEEGHYRVHGVSPGLQHVRVRRQGYRELVRELEIEDGVNAADFNLTGGRRVAGLAVDAADLPLAGVELQLEPIAPTSADRYLARSGEDGAFELEPVADGRYRIRAQRQGYVAAAEPEVQVTASPVDDLVIRLETGMRLEGRVLGLDFEELSRVEVRAEARGRVRGGEVDYDGNYRIDDLESWDWTVLASLDSGRREVRSRVAIEPESTVVNRDLEFGRGVTLSGVALSGGEPLSGAQIEIRGHDMPVRRSVATDFEGRFRLEDLDSGDYRLSLSSPRRRLVHNRDLALHFDRDVVIEIDAGSIAGTVVDAETGEGIASASVAMLEILDEGREGSLVTVATGAEGRFGYDGLTASRYQIRVQHNGYQPIERWVEVAPGAVTDGVKLALDRAAGLEVAVRLASGEEPRFITVWGRDSAGRTYAETRVSDRGVTQFATLPGGRWSLLVGAEGGSAVEQWVEVPNEPLTLVLPDAGRLRVRIPTLVEADTLATLQIFGEAGRPFRHLAWGGVLQESWPVVGGMATVEGIPAGVWSLQVRSQNGASWSGLAATTGGPDIEVSLE